MLLAAVVAALASTASALSFDWAATGVTFDSTKLKSNAGVTGYLIYLASGSYSEVTLSADSTGTSVAESLGTIVSTANKTTAVSKLAGTASFDYGTYNNGDVFGLVLTYADSSSGKTYFNIASGTYTLSGVSDETSTPSDASYSFSWSGPTESSKASSGGGWTAVPEPSTAALALAGLALLLKRRKA